MVSKDFNNLELEEKENKRISIKIIIILLLIILIIIHIFYDIIILKNSNIVGYLELLIYMLGYSIKLILVLILLIILLCLLLFPFMIKLGFVTIVYLPVFLIIGGIISFFIFLL